MILSVRRGARVSLVALTMILTFIIDIGSDGRIGAVSAKGKT